MFIEKVATIAPKKDDVVIDMVLVVTTCSQMSLYYVVFKEIKLPKNKSLANWQEEEKHLCLFEKAIKDIRQKEPRGLLRASIQILVKTNLIRNLSSDTKITL